MSWVGFFWVLLALLQVADIWTTWYAIERIGGAYEKNPVMRWAFNLWGVLPALITVKSAMLVAIWWLSPPIEAFGLVVLMYLWVCLNNWQVIARR